LFVDALSFSAPRGSRGCGRDCDGARADCAASSDFFLSGEFNFSSSACAVTRNISQTFGNDYYTAYNGFVAIADSTGHMNTSDPNTMDGDHGLYAADYCNAYLPAARSIYQCAPDDNCRAGTLADCRSQTSGASSTFLLRESSLTLNGVGLSCPGVTSCETFLCLPRTERCPHLGVPL
jgi:hypothetical protein